MQAPLKNTTDRERLGQNPQQVPSLLLPRLSSASSSQSPNSMNGDYSTRQLYRRKNRLETTDPHCKGCLYFVPWKSGKPSFVPGSLSVQKGLYVEKKKIFFFSWVQPERGCFLHQGKHLIPSLDPHCTHLEVEGSLRLPLKVPFRPNYKLSQNKIWSPRKVPVQGVNKHSPSHPPAFQHDYVDTYKHLHSQVPGF